MECRFRADIDQLIGKTPLLELTHIEEEAGLKAHILAKLEYFNPAGSVKDRIAKAIIDEAEVSGKLKPGSTIIEPISGNTRDRAGLGGRRWHRHVSVQKGFYYDLCGQCSYHKNERGCH